MSRDVTGSEGKLVGAAVVDFSLARENAAFVESRNHILWLCMAVALATANYQTAESGAYSIRGNGLPSGERERNPYDQFGVGVGLGWDLPL